MTRCVAHLAKRNSYPLVKINNKIYHKVGGETSKEIYHIYTLALELSLWHRSIMYNVTMVITALRGRHHSHPLYGSDNWRRMLSTSGCPSVLCSNMVGTLGNNSDPPTTTNLLACDSRSNKYQINGELHPDECCCTTLPAAVTVSKNSLIYRIVSLQWRKTITTKLPVCLTFLQLELRGGDVYAPWQWQWATAPSQLCQCREKELVCDSIRCCMVLR